MTKTIEFIDREISSTEIDLWYSKRLLIENPPKEELKKELLECKINVLERNMKILQQIKLELEAWEVVKENVDVYGHEYNGELVEYVQITEEQLPDEKHINIIKKAKGYGEEIEVYKY